jgi:hypothetical protein
MLGGLLLTVAIANGGQRYLGPIQPYPPSTTEYHQQVYKVLIGSRPSVFWMMGIVNSFGTERAVILRKLEKADTTGLSYELEYAVATQPIWRWKKDGDSTVMDYRTDGPIDRRKAMLPDSAANIVTSVWRDVLRQTCYAENWEIGSDGEEYEFFAEPNLYGWVWNPATGLPRTIADLGEMLGQYVQAKEHKRPEVLRRALEIAEKLRVELSKGD